MQALFIKKENAHFVLWLLSPLIGIAVGYGVLGFRYGIDLVHWLWLQGDMESVIARAMTAPWWQVMAGPLLVGLVAALMLRFVMIDSRPLGVADILLARDMQDRYISPKAGLLSAMYAVLCLGGGGSAGRESPAIHLGVAITIWIGRFFALPPSIVHVLFACGTGAAVAASFNAPLAGMLFAHEVILRHIALPSIMPIAIACVTATAVTHIHLGDFPTFRLPEFSFTSGFYNELPYFVLLGIICALVASVFVILIFRLTDWNKRLPTIIGAEWTRPLWVGLLTAVAAVFVPQLIGVGYEVTNDALQFRLELWLILLLIPLKLILTALTLAGRFGGGVFSPALYLGALTGSAFGLLMLEFSEGIDNHYILYAIAGMGGVSAAVLGAPLSTILIAFELIGDYQIVIALMVTVTVATAIAHAILGEGFFHLQAKKVKMKLRMKRLR